jgi:hypothetical protein
MKLQNQLIETIIIIFGTLSVLWAALEIIFYFIR